MKMRKSIYVFVENKKKNFIRGKSTKDMLDMEENVPYGT